MTKFTFEMYHEVTEQTIVEAESQQQAEAMVLSGNCKWEVDRSEDGGDFYLVDEEEVETKINPTPFIERLKDAYYKKDDTGIKINAQGIPITYANKDELSEEDFK